MMSEQEIQNRLPGTERMEPIFALDIGTRSIIGVVGIPKGDLFEVLAIERMEHTRRAMIDGQIEDIEQTAKVAGVVRDRLERRLDIRLSNVCVAAAGRALKTHKASSERELDPNESVDSRGVFELEMQAIEQAREAVTAESGDAEGRFYCVGHSVIRYHLDGYPLSTLLGHRGRNARVDIIATFLPVEVVESLYTAMRRIGLAVSSLTLEPIAAMNAIIPQELRLLNLALVDIGAGTSDIALSNDGSVVAYTMATIAGDEVSEAIIRAYLVDFDTAEAIKLSLTQEGDSVQFNNILGFANTVSKAEVIAQVSAAVESLCEEICSRILEANGHPPAAVFLVGGGSRYPMLCDMVAKRLSLEANKVAVGGNNYMKRLVASGDDITGPDLATPLGIAITAAAQRDRDGFSVTLNGRRFQLFKSSAATVMDVLLMAGYRQSQIMGRSGRSVTFELNGRKSVVRGGYPVAAVIRVNGAPASLSTPVLPDAEVTIEDAVSGEDAKPVVSDAAPDWSEFEVTIDGVPCPAGSRALLNGQPVGRDAALDNFDSLELYQVDTPDALCREIGIDLGDRGFLVNGVLCSGRHRLLPGDAVQICDAGTVAGMAAAEAQAAPPEAREPELPPQPEPDRPQTPEPAAPPAGEVSVQRFIQVNINGRTLSLPAKEDGMPYLFVDMLNHVDIDPTKPKGNIVLSLNGREASYLATVANGDVIDIHWDGE